MLKKVFTLFNCFLLSSALFAQNQNVTFQVSNPDSTPVFIFGSWSNFGNWPGNMMSPLGGGKFSITLLSKKFTFDMTWPHFLRHAYLWGVSKDAGAFLCRDHKGFVAQRLLNKTFAQRDT